MAGLQCMALMVVVLAIHTLGEPDAQYGYSPTPVYHPEPTYQVTPAYGVPHSHTAHHVATVHSTGVAHQTVVHAAGANGAKSVLHHQSVARVHHPAQVSVARVHHPAHATPQPYHAGPPACSLDSHRPWCLEDLDYPTYEIEHALKYHYEGVQAIYKDVLVNTANSVDRLNEIVQETYLCPSQTAYIRPLRAVNTEGKWRIIVNEVKAHYETLTQTARIEECLTHGEACPLVPACYQTKCLQKSVYHRFLVYDAYDHYFPFAIETFQLPSACACYNGDYIEPPPHSPPHSM